MRHDKKASSRDGAPASRDMNRGRGISFIRRLFLSDHPWGLVLAALLLRIPFLGRTTLWQDEIGFVRLADPAISVGQLLASSWNMIVTIGQLPFSFLVWNVYFKGVSLFFENVIYSTLATRIPSLFFGLLALYVVNRLARRLFNEKTALVIGILFAGLFFPVFYSREAYCYPLILFLAPFTLYETTCLLFDERGKERTLAFVFLGSSALLYSHLGGLMFVLSTAGLLLVGWLLNLGMLKNRQRAGRFFSAGVALGLSLAGFSPYLIRFVKHNTAHTGGAPYSVPVILNDVVGKLFLGEHVFFAVLAWILFVCGIAWLLRSPTRRTEYRFFAGIVLLTMLMLAWATSRSQYLSVRYFSPVAPFVIMVFGVGIRAISDWVAARLKRDWSDYLAFGFTGLVLVCTFFMYLIPLYGLKHKEADQFSSVAEWLNGHLEPGTPYLWYSGYLMRWVPGYYPTPGLQAVSPYVHGPGREELARLNERHLDFIRRFPVSAFVGPTHETIDVEAGLWPWPKQRYKRHAEVTDESLKRLARRGIFIWEPYRKWTREDGTTDIFYNTREDAVDVVRDRGDAAYFDFAGWQCQAVAGHPQGLWMEYAWAIEGARASIRVMNVRPEAVSGRLVLHAAAAGFQGGRFPLRLVLDGQACGGGEVTAGQFVAIASEPVRLPVGQWVELQLDARSPGMNNPRALLVHDAQFLPGPSPQP